MQTRAVLALLGKQKISFGVEGRSRLAGGHTDGVRALEPVHQKSSRTHAGLSPGEPQQGGALD